MKLVLTIFVLIAISQLQLWGVNSQVCTSTDDPHMKTFDNTFYEFHYDGSHFILYDDFKETRVTASYQPCYYHKARCNCAIYIKKGDTLAFLDFCGATDNKKPLNKFYTVTKIGEQNHGYEAIKNVTCRPILPGDENNEDIWQLIVPANQYFKCAQIGEGTYLTYVIRTFDTRTPNDIIQVKVKANVLSLPRIEVKPSVNSFRRTGGLCGLWNNNKSRDLYVLNDNGLEEFTLDTNRLKDFWRLDSKWSKHANKRCPECFLQAEKRIYCPCDNFSLSEANSNPFNAPYCQVPMVNCVEKSLHLPLSPIIQPTTTSTFTTTPSMQTTEIYTTSKPGFTYEQALAICENAILNNPALIPFINMGLIDPSQFIHNCLQDLLLTGEIALVQLHVDLAITSALENSMKNETIIDGGDLLGLCPKNCSGNGQCVVNIACTNVTSESEDLEELRDCLSPVICQCNPLYGGVDCSIDVSNVPEFSLSETCCDVRNYDCSQVRGYGYPLARRPKLTYKILYSETDNSYIFDGSYSGYATVISDNEFVFNLPLQEIWRHNTSFVDVRVGLSYDGVNYRYQNLLLYDSVCRTCGEYGIDENNNDVCIIENQCYYNGQAALNDQDNICNTTLDKYEWTFIGNPCQVVVSVDGSPIIVNENENVARFTINLPEYNECPLQKELKVGFHAEENTATYNDFYGLTNFVTFLPGERSKTVEYAIYDNNVIEPTRFFTFVIDSVDAVNYEIRNRKKVIFIKDDDYNNPNALLGDVFDLMNRTHAEKAMNIYSANEYFFDIYELCPGEGGLTASYKTLDMFFEFLDSDYKLYTIEIHNNNECNVNDMYALLTDKFGDILFDKNLNSLYLNNFTFIDLNYIAKYVEPNINVYISKLEAIIVSIFGTRDGLNPTKCELRIFGNRVPSKKN